MVAHVLVERRAKTINQLFSYRVPKELEPQIKIGVRVKVPFGRTKVEGFVLDLSAFIKTTYQLKDIIKIVDLKPVLNKEMLALGQYISTQTLCYLIEAYQVMLPTALKAKINRKIKIKTEKYLSLAVMRDNLETLKLTKRGQEIVTNLLLKPKIKKKELTNISTSAVTTLLKKGVIKETNEEIYRLEDTISNYQPITLTKEQNVVINKIKASFFQPQTFLLHGVTGSGKTEVYMELVGEVIKLGKEAIILVPEISLTPQMVRRFKSRFSNQVAILHSALSAGEKYDEWRKIERKEVSIVIGARSAIFAPLTNLGLIIIDEEHVATYKQENHPRY
ncbi:MAG: DEAD/DEAH box helicase, partial [Bacilli bacterium]